jgi:phosphatidylglycerol lysyltransferase
MGKYTIEDDHHHLWQYKQQGHLELAQRHAIELVRDFGNETLSFFGLAPENAYYLAPCGDGVVNYRLSGNVAVLPGDPVCKPGAFENVIGHFLNFCQRERCHLAIYQVHPAYLPLYRKLDLHSFKIGEEAILHPQAFTLSGKALANVRQSSRKAERAGVMLCWYDGSPPHKIVDQLQELSQVWLAETFGKGEIEMGFSLGRVSQLPAMAARAEIVADRLTPSKEDVLEVLPRLITGVAFDRAGQACAFVTCTPIYGTVQTPSTETGQCPQRHGWGWALDMMRRKPDAPYGVIDLLITRALQRCHMAGAEVFSLGLIALADNNQEMMPMQRELTSCIAPHIHLLKLHHMLMPFKQKFQPTWESRYLVISDSLALPKVVRALLRVHQS